MRSPYQIVEQHYQASARKDLAGMMADVSPTARWTEMDGFPCAGTWIGPEEVIEHVFKVLGSEWQDYRFELQQLVDGGDTVVGIGDYHGIYRATGKAMQARVVHVWKVQAAKIVGFEQFTDTLRVAQAMAA